MDNAVLPVESSRGDVLLSLIHGAQVLQDRIERALESVGLSWAKYGVLSLLVEAGESLTLSDLAARSSCVRSNMTQLMNRLEADGLVRRMDDPADRRVVRAAITPLGEERYAAGAGQMRKMQRDFAALLSESDREVLRRVLAAIE